jgi:uncharacterized protein (DUF697 family)
MGNFCTYVLLIIILFGAVLDRSYASVVVDSLFYLSYGLLIYQISISFLHTFVIVEIIKDFP